MLKIVNRHFTPLNKKAELAFVKANSRFEDTYLSFGDMKNAVSLITYHQTADQLVESVILLSRLTRTV